MPVARAMTHASMVEGIDEEEGVHAQRSTTGARRGRRPRRQMGREPGRTARCVEYKARQTLATEEDSQNRLY